MGRKTKKYKEDKISTTADIRNLLRRQQGAMKPLSDRLSYSSSETSLPDMEELAPITRRPRADLPVKRSKGSPVTEGRLKDLLDVLHSNLAADIKSFKEEISGVLRRLYDATLR
ncbi:Hypothetical predicted protein [Pelobates cultripes]|uniref:Uncharacterized protein n=1 Tax=Pelobates cultripes TaxID=61616 RepID=A0AAD1VQ52_PELCU|nr:Hypothetical predicted protein [Pelobates cultripes]